MRSRLVLVPVLAGALAVMTVGASAAPKTLDGKKVKQLTITASGGAQDHDQDLASLSGPDRTECEMPRCARLPFVYLPAKGIKGDLMFTVTWTNPASDIDLYVGEIGKDGSSSDIGHCAGAGTASEKLFIPKSALKPGKKYVLVVDFFRSLNETATGTVAINVPNTTKTTVPAQADGKVQNINCTL